MSKGYVSVREASAALNVPERTLYSWVKRGDVPSSKENGKTVIPASYLDSPQLPERGSRPAHAPTNIKLTEVSSPLVEERRRHVAELKAEAELEETQSDVESRRQEREKARQSQRIGDSKAAVELERMRFELKREQDAYERGLAAEKVRLAQQVASTQQLQQRLRGAASCARAWATQNVPLSEVGRVCEFAQELAKSAHLHPYEREEDRVFLENVLDQRFAREVELAYAERHSALIGELVDDALHRLGLYHPSDVGFEAAREAALEEARFQTTLTAASYDAVYRAAKSAQHQAERRYRLEGMALIIRAMRR